MFGIKRKSREPSGRKSPEQEGDATERKKPDQGAAEAGDTLLTQIANLEEVVNKRTKGLEETGEQLRQFSNTAKSSAEDKDVLAQPHKPLRELTVESEEEPPGEEQDLSILLGKPGEEEEQENEEESVSFSNLFDSDEEEVNPLAGLIASLPDVSANELLVEAREIEEMMRQGQQN